MRSYNFLQKWPQAQILGAELKTKKEIANEELESEWTIWTAAGMRTPCGYHLQIPFSVETLQAFTNKDVSFGSNR